MLRTYAAGIEMEDPARWRAFETLMDEAYGRVLELTHLFRLARRRIYIGTMRVPAFEVDN